MPMESEIVAVGLLTQGDLAVLGQGYRRAIPVSGLEGFEDLLAQLDIVEATPRRPREAGEP